MCLRNKVLRTLGYVRNFTYLDAVNITSKQKTDMAKVAIKNENITSFGGIYHIMDVYSKLGFERHGWQATDRSGNDFRHARKRQTFRETTFAMRGNAKPFGKRLSPCAEMPNLSGNDFRHARKC